MAAERQLARGRRRRRGDRSARALHRGGPLRVLAVWAVLGWVAACGPASQPRSEVWAAVWAEQAAFYRAAWGAEPGDEVERETRRRFDCVWDGLEDEDVDPAPELACWRRQMSALGDCLAELASEEPPPDCVKVARGVCAMGQRADAVMARCAAEGRRR